MFCANCGTQLEEGAKFCGNCGARVEQEEEGRQEPIFEQEENVETTEIGNAGEYRKKKGPRKPLIAVLLVLAVLIFGTTAYATAGLNMQKDKWASKIEKSGIEEFNDEKKEILSDWKKMGLTDISEKRKAIRELKEVHKDVEAYDTCIKELKTLQKEKENYHLDDEAYAAYEESLSECEEAVKDEEAENVLECFEEVKTAQKELIAANDSYIKNKMDVYKNIDMKEAGKEETAAYEKAMKNLESLEKAKKKDYPAYKEAFEKVDETVYMYLTPENPLEVDIQQVDASAFPKVKLYVSLKDTGSGEVPEELEDDFFYIQKKDANQKYVKQVVTEVNQLNEEEGLTIDMVADVSGSMSGSPLMEAQNIMCNFINSVQFDAGDMVELTSFSTGVRLEQEFCAEPDVLVNKVRSLMTSDQTSLYDALYTAVERVAGQSGARCVIAFTDGEDNYSNCTKEQVVNVAKRYHIPIFIIGIGSINSADVSYIASETGGGYYNVGAVNSMESIYDEIYRMEKELYLVEFEDNTGATAKDVANIRAGYRSIDYGGECEYSYEPNVLMSAKSESIYKDGPEAVVEKYLKNFAAAVTNSDFSLISDCLKSGSPIYNEQQKYVQRNISETLDTYEIMDVTYKGQNNCVVSTRETFYVQVAGKPLQLMTQECKYAMEKSGNDWKMTAFEDLKVVSRIKQ